MTPGELASAIRERLRASGRVRRKPFFRRPSESTLIRAFALLWVPSVLVGVLADDASRLVVPFLAGLVGVALLQGTQLQNLMVLSPQARFLRYLPAEARDLTRSTFGLWLRGWLWCLLIVGGLVVRHGEGPFGARLAWAGGVSLLVISTAILLVTLLPFENRGALLGNGGLLLVLLALVAGFRQWRVPIDPAVLRVQDATAAVTLMTVASLILLRLAYHVVENRWAKRLIETEVVRLAPRQEQELESGVVSHIPTQRAIAKRMEVPFSGLIESAVWRVLNDEERPVAAWLCGEVQGAWSKGSLVTFVALAILMLNPNLLVFALFGFQALVGRFPGWVGSIGSGFVISPALFPVRGRIFVSTMIKVQLVRSGAAAIPLLLLARMTNSLLWIPVLLVAAQPIAVAARVMDGARPTWRHTPLVLFAFAPLGVGMVLLIQRLFEPGPMQSVIGWMAVGECTMVGLAVWVLERGRVDLVQRLRNSFGSRPTTTVSDAY